MLWPEYHSFIRTPRAALLVLLFAAPAHALPEDEIRDLFPDIRGPLRIGGGESNLLGGAILSAGFQDEIRVKRLADWAEVDLVFGLDSQSGPGHGNGFSDVDLGLAFALHDDARGPLFVFGATFGALTRSGGSSFSFDGYGGAARIELYPMYRDIVDAVVCREGPLVDWAFSGLHLWALGRIDSFLGESGRSWALGAGMDLGREVLLPILGAILDTSCFDASLRATQ